MATATVNTCRWLEACPVTGCPRLRINGQDYDLTTVKTGYRLERLDPATFELVAHTIDTTWGHGCWRCSCPDARHRRPYSCKHVRALRAAINAAPF